MPISGDGFAYSASLNATNVYMKPNEPPIVANAGATDNTYYVCVGDINADGYRHLLILATRSNLVGLVYNYQTTGRTEVVFSPTGLARLNQVIQGTRYLVASELDRSARSTSSSLTARQRLTASATTAGR